jgi:hypothetical protein
MTGPDRRNEAPLATFQQYQQRHQQGSLQNAKTTMNQSDYNTGTDLTTAEFTRPSRVRNDHEPMLQLAANSTVNLLFSKICITHNGSLQGQLVEVHGVHAAFLEDFGDVVDTLFRTHQCNRTKQLVAHWERMQWSVTGQAFYVHCMPPLTGNGSLQTTSVIQTLLVNDHLQGVV